jgi:HD-GYP domain-containing protein (c-di-GMP phosphodiesterase class II)
MLTDRPYRAGRSEDLAIEELRRCAGTQFDPDVIEAFLLARQKEFPATLPSTIHPAVELAYGPGSAA